MTNRKPVAKRKGARPPKRNPQAAKAAREASISRQRMKARILALEGRISVVESFLLDARKE